MQQQYHLRQSWLWLMFLPLLIIMSSCSGTDTDDAGNPPAASTMPISFTALSKWDEAKAQSSDAPHTRLSEDATTKALSFDKDDAIGVFAYLNDSQTPNFMNNQLAVCTSTDGSSWSYTPVKYWPNNDADALSFYAYYPYRDGSDGDTIQAVPASNAVLKIKYSCPNANIDLMATQKVAGQKYSSHQGRVPFTFEHLLARVKFSFTYVGEDEYHPVIHVLKYTIPHYKGTVTCPSSEGSNFSWDISSAQNEDTAYIVRYVTDVAGTVLHEKNQVIPEFTSYILPGSFPYSPTAEGNIGSFVISLNNKLYTYTPSSRITVEAGKSYTVNFKVTTDYGGSGNFFITSYSIWKDGGTIEGTLE